MDDCTGTLDAFQYGEAESGQSKYGLAGRLSTNFWNFGLFQSYPWVDNGRIRVNAY